MDYLGDDQADKVRPTIDANLTGTLGLAGYAITGGGQRPVFITAGAPEGLVNGYYSLLREMIVVHETDPAFRNWDVKESPAFRVRGMELACFLLNLDGLSADVMTWPEWKEYLDLLRLLNINTVTCFPMFVYHPDYPETHKHRWKYKVWKKAIAYAHELGMQWHMFTVNNMVPPRDYWEIPEARNQTWGYMGNTLSRLHPKGLERIRAVSTLFL